MTDKVQKIREKVVEIVNSINLFIPDEDGKNSNYEAGKLDAATQILQIIDSLDEPVSEDLGEYLNELSKQFPEVSFAKLSRIGVRVAKWQKEQMIAKAIVREVKVDAGGYPYISQIELYDYDKDELLAKKGDRVKVIVIKED